MPEQPSPAQPSQPGPAQPRPAQPPSRIACRLWTQAGFSEGLKTRFVRDVWKKRPVWSIALGPKSLIFCISLRTSDKNESFINTLLGQAAAKPPSSDFQLFSFTYKTNTKSIKTTSGGPPWGKNLWFYTGFITFSEFLKITDCGGFQACQMMLQARFLRRAQKLIKTI